MKRSILLGLMLVLIAGIAEAAGDDDPIRAVLDKQVAAWNRGNIDDYMAGYARGNETMFVGAEVTRGWTNVRDRYKAKYTSRATMGTLAFSDLDVRYLCDDAVVVTGAWTLTRKDGTPHGRFTLIFRWIEKGAGWKIVYDHSS